MGGHRLFDARFDARLLESTVPRVLTVSCTCHSIPPSELSSASTAANSLIPRTCTRICGRDEKSVRCSRPGLTNRGAVHWLVEKLNAREHTVHRCIPTSLSVFLPTFRISLLFLFTVSPSPPSLFLQEISSFCLYIHQGTIVSNRFHSLNHGWKSRRNIGGKNALL